MVFFYKTFKRQKGKVGMSLKPRWLFLYLDPKLCMLKTPVSLSPDLPY